ncbi:MAG: hypothetical protein NXI24_09595 [bacterium]|nr:hypothetical protein [bacterium]
MKRRALQRGSVFAALLMYAGLSAAAMLAWSPAGAETPENAPAALPLPGESGQNDPAGWIAYYEDAAGELTIADVARGDAANRFESLAAGTRINFGYTTSAYWLRLPLQNTSDRTLVAYLELVSLIDSIRVYTPRMNAAGADEFEMNEYGRWEPLAKRDVKHRNFIFRISLEPHETRTLYMRFESKGALLLPLTLWTAEAFAAKDHEEQIIFGMYFGVLFVMVFYNFFLFVWLRDRSYFYYVCFILGYGLIQAGVWGFAHEYVFDWNLWLANYSIPLFIGFASFFGLQFCRKFLDTKSRSPIAHKIILGFSALAAAQFVYTLFGDYGLAIRLGLAIGFSTALVMMITSLISLIRGYRAARYFFLAFIVLLLGVLVIILRNFAVLPFHFITNYANLIGSAVQVVLLSLALGDRFNQIRAEHLASQAAALEQERRYNEAFARFVPGPFLQLLGRESITDIRLGDSVEREMTILFSDIREFTSISENMTARENFGFINEYLKELGPVVRDSDGFIDKYIGDSIMALFPEAPVDAVRAALLMRARLKDFNKLRAQKDLPPIGTGIGVHTGPTMLGTIGHETRMEGTVISDAVNIAARLEGLTKRLNAPVLISEDVRAGLGSHSSEFETRFLGRVRVKGKSSEIRIHEVLAIGVDSEADAKLRLRETFEAGVAAVLAGDPGPAREKMQRVIAENPADRAASLYLESFERDDRNAMDDAAPELD